MTDELVIKSSPKKGILVLILSIALVALSIWAIDEKPFLGWVGAVFFGLGVPASLMMLRPNHMYLKLDSEGFDLVVGKRHNITRWGDVQRFEMGKMSGNKLIGIHYSPEYQAQRGARAVASSLAGIEAVIADHWALSLDEVLLTLEEYRQRYG